MAHKYYIVALQSHIDAWDVRHRYFINGPRFVAWLISSQHLQSSDRLSLRKYLDTVADGSVTIELHTFGPKSPANELAIRRAYESEMIRSREPRLNVRP